MEVGSGWATEGNILPRATEVVTERTPCRQPLSETLFLSRGSPCGEGSSALAHSLAASQIGLKTVPELAAAAAAALTSVPSSCHGVFEDRSPGLDGFGI